MLASLTSLVRECGQTKTTKEKGTKKVSWHWDKVHQQAFNHMKATIPKEVILAYPDYSNVFEIYTDASSKQLGAVITQDNRPVTFFGQILSATQCKYSVNKIDILSSHSRNNKRVQRDVMSPTYKNVYLSQKSHERCSRLNL
jgi:hypothetical protein